MTAGHHDRPIIRPAWAVVVLLGAVCALAQGPEGLTTTTRILGAQGTVVEVEEPLEEPGEELPRALIGMDGG